MPGKFLLVKKPVVRRESVFRLFHCLQNRLTANQRIFRKSLKEFPGTRQAFHRVGFSWCDMGHQIGESLTESSERTAVANVIRQAKRKKWTIPGNVQGSLVWGDRNPGTTYMIAPCSRYAPTYYLLLGFFTVISNLSSSPAFAAAMRLWLTSDKRPGFPTITPARL